MLCYRALWEQDEHWRSLRRYSEQGLEDMTLKATFLASLGKVAEMCFQRTVIPSSRVMLAQERQLKI